ncbi:MAG TPA: TonB-dependent receptor [Candidatus Acidoferrales bacterium]|nr:TonB-dependent receptor [Candidatus Acidoferrales bacterium]
MRSRYFLFALALMLLISSASWSQDTRGSIVGRVTDPSGAVVPDATVVVSNPATGSRSTATTNADGIYRVPLLPPGLYQIEVTSRGFKKALRNDVEVRVADRLDINIALEIGASEQQVTVVSETPVLNAESASMGTVIDSKRVSDLPLSYGNPFLLIGLTAGVTYNGSVRLDRPFEPTHIVNFSMGGTSGLLNDITIDGAPTTSRANPMQVTASYVPPTDIVQEFKVQTATFDAQFGQTQGGVTNISIKSGTNNLHGTVSYSFQRPSFWANDFFLNKAGTPRPDFLFNRWGGSVGGPVYIPKVYNGKNKTFFLFGYEGIHDSRPRHDDTTNTVPTPAEHNGDFSALLAAGSSYTIYDPATRVAVAGGRFQETAFPGNKIPANRFDPVGVKILSYYPSTEKTPGDVTGLNNYLDASVAEKAKYYNWTGRVDQNLGDRQRFYVRYSTYTRNSTYNNYFENAFVGTQFWFYSKAAVADHVITLSPTMVLNTRYSFNRFIRGSDAPASAVGFDPTTLGFSTQFASQIPKDVLRFPRVNLTGYISNGSTGENRPTNNHTISSTLTKSAGKQSIRTGFEFRVYQQADRFFSNSQSGQFTFGSTWTRGPLDNSATSPGSIGQSVAELLLGLPDSANINRAADYFESSSSWGFFVQDDWKLAPKLTLNLGLRYEFETPMFERFDKSTLGFDTSYVQPISAAAQANYATIYPTIPGGFPQLPPSAFALKGGMTFEGLNGNDGSLYHTPKNVFMPRVGLAYQFDNQTVLRTGFGMFAGFLGQRRGDVQQNGFSQTTTMVQTTDNGLHFLTPIANPFPSGVTEPRGAADGPQTYLGQGFTFFNQNPKVPVTMRWELSLQRQFKNFVLEAAYVGSKTNHIEVTRNINTLPYQYLSTSPVRDDTYNNLLTASIPNPMYNLLPGNTQSIYTGSTTSRQTLLSPYPAFGSSAINTTDNTGYSWYHGLQFTATKRFNKGYTVIGSYTYSKWMQAVNLLNAADRLPIREISDSDAPHRINISSVWSLPFGRGRALLSGANGFVERLVGGWELSGIWSLQSGFALPWGNVIYYGNPADIVLPLDQRTPEHWFNVTNFETNSARQLLGNQVRTWPFRFSTIRGPRQNNIDVALIKQTRITEGKNLEFRAEALNFANHPYFPNPSMSQTTAQTVKDTGFGQISASTQSNYARRLQLSLRFLF